MSRFSFKLFITGRTNRSERAIEQVHRMCNQELGGDCDLSIVDVLESPELAESDRVLATPTLIKNAPPPEKRIIGDLQDIEKVMSGLGLRRGLASTNRREA